MTSSAQLDADAISLSIVGPGADSDVATAATRAEKFRIIEGDELRPWIERCVGLHSHSCTALTLRRLA